ncbi:MAG: hypothetical protein HDS82_00190 [Bacteroidales bacterium]|nr:hypothetical protein [Bacteroidales bacterium]
MKRTFRRILTIVSVAVGLLYCSSEASAQRGEKTLGVAGGYATYNDGGYANIYFQYTFADHFRIAPEMGYVFRSEGASAFTMSVDMQFPFRVARGLSLYPLAGLTFNNWSYRHDGHATRAGADFGGGIDLYLTSNLKLTLQGKYSVMNDTGGGYIGMGIGYVF